MGKYDDNTVDRIMDMYHKEHKSGQKIASELGIPRSTVYYYIQKNTDYDDLPFTKRNFRYLINRSKHLESVVSVLQESNCSANDPLRLILKELELYRRVYRLEREFKESIAEYMRFYNEDRPHKTLHYKTPIQFEAEYYNGGKSAKDKQ